MSIDVDKPTESRVPERFGEPPRVRSQPQARGELNPVTLVFLDPAVEGAFRADYARRNLMNIRIAHALGAVIWVVWGVLLHGSLSEDRGLDLAIRYGVLIPLALAGLALTFTRVYLRIWEAAAVSVLVITAITWTTYAAAIESMPVDWVYVGLILIMAFGYSVLRLRFVIVSCISALMVAYYQIEARVTGNPSGLRLTLATFYLLSFLLVAMFASYTLERSTRLLFLRERQLDRERERSDSLLLNVLPRAIAERLKGRDEKATGGLAQGLDEVTVLFADAEGFTRQAEKTSPEALVAALDDLFTRFDALADRFGLEKIKTVGDAYMAAAGVPDPRPDHAAATADLALAIHQSLEGCVWPSGDPIRVRVGMACGPVVAGVIGRRKFSYDVWGDTVNLASRLESHGEPGRILVSEAVAERLEWEFEFGPRDMVDLKGKGPTPARFLLGRKHSGEAG